MRRLGLWCGLGALLVLVAGRGVLGAETTSAVDGEWVLRLGIHTLMVLSVAPGKDAGQAVSGTLARPTHLQTRDMHSFSQMVGPTKVEAVVASAWKGNGLAFTVQDPADKSDETSYLLRLKDATHAELEVVGAPMGPMELVRAQGPVAVSEDWEPGRTYSPEDDAASNPEMKKIFDEDQRVRAVGPFKIDWSVVSKTDAARRAETMKLLQDGALHSGEDFAWAAFVFQHGGSPNDYLLAHTLAMVAVRRGYSDAIWIAAATLDRYLQSVKQRQIYGTQFLTPKGKPATQEPYDRTLIPDALRRDLDVPVIAAQEKQRQQYDAERKAAQ